MHAFLVLFGKQELKLMDQPCKSLLTKIFPLYAYVQDFPGDLLEHTYPNPKNPRQLLARSELDRRGNYFERLERKFQESAGYPLVGVVNQCLANFPKERPTAEQLVRVLEGLKGDIEGPCGKLATVDAMRQVMTAMALKKKSRDEVDEMTVKEEIQQLQQQLEVQHLYTNARFVHIHKFA